MKYAVYIVKVVVGVWALAIAGGATVRADEFPLPEGYVPLEWISSTRGGHQYIDTKYKPLVSDVVTCVVDVERVQSAENTWASIFGCKVDNSKNSYVLFSHKGNAAENLPGYGRDAKTATGQSKSFFCGRKTMVVCNASNVRWWPLDDPDTIETLTLAATQNCGNNMYIFTENIGPANGSSLHDSTWNTMKLYSFVIEDKNGAKIRDFIPCRNTDRRPGLWDKVTGEFYPNANSSATENFHGSDDSHGPDDVDVFVSYIRSSAGGDQYLNTKYLASVGDVVSCVVDVESVQDANSSKWAAVFGSRVKNGQKGYVFFTHNGNVSLNMPWYCRDPGTDAGLPGDFTCGRRTKIVCNASTAQWWPLDDPEAVKTLTVSATQNCGNEMFVFVENSGDTGKLLTCPGTFCAMKLYSFKIESAGTVVRDLRPYCTADGRLGVYDIADHSWEAGYDPFYPNQGRGGEFSWGGVAYTRENGGTTIALREGELSDFDLKGYALVKKTASTLVDASIVTNYPALALERGTFSLQDGAALEYRVANALTLTGGAHLAIDLLETENDRFLADTVDLSGASAANPVVIDITAHGISSLAPDAMRPLIAGSGLTADDAAKFTINGFAAEVAVVDGSLVMRGRSLADFVWSGADADTNDWSAPGNWDGQSVPPSGAVAAFDLTAGGTTTFDLARFSVKGVRFGAEAGAFTHVGEERLSLLSFVTNLSQNAQSFSMPLSLGIAGQPFDLYTVGALTLSGDVATPGASLRVRGPGRLTIDDTVIAQSAEVELAAGVTRINHTGRQTTAGMPGELRIGPEAQLDLNILGTDTFAKAEPIHCKTVVLSGDGPDHEGALVNSAAGSDNVETSLIGHLKLAGDAAIGSRSTLGARIDVRGLSGSACNDVIVEGPYTLTVNPGNFIVLTDVCFELAQVDDRGHFIFLGTQTSGVITNGIHVKNGAILNAYDATVPAGIPVVFDEGTGFFYSLKTSTLNGSLIVQPGATAAMSNQVSQVLTWAGAVTNEGTIAQHWTGSVVFSGALHGSGRLEGANIRMSETGCWHLAHGDEGWTERMDVASAADFLPSVRQMEIELNDSVLPTQPLAIALSGGLTAVQAAQNILLTVRDGTGTVIPNCWLGVTDGNLELHVADARLVRTAVWTGRGEDPDDLSDTANWACTNDVGAAVADGLPMSATTVVIPGTDCRFNIPAGAAITCRELTFTYPVTLAEDCDWRGLDAVIGGPVDLRGRKLTVSRLKGTGTITDSTECWQPVEYIQSSGTQFINTGYRYAPTDKIVCTVEISTSGQGDWGTLFGAIRGNSSNYSDAYALFVADGKANTATLKYIRGPYVRNVFTNDGKTRGGKITITCQGYEAMWTDGTTSGTATVPEGTYLGAAASKIPMLIFNLNLAAQEGDVVVDATTKCSAKLYSFQIFNSEGVLQRDFVPVRKLPSGAGALYDRVAGEYYENAGTGTFGVGRAIGSVQAGELHFDVPDGTTETNSSVKFTGAVRLVKDGEGTLVQAMGGQEYAGGTEVREGTFTYGTSAFPAGPLNASVKVDEGATLDMNGLISVTQCIYSYDLAGTVRQVLQGGGGWSNNERCFGDITLTGDATIIGAGYLLENPLKSPGLLSFNGHKLTLDLTGTQDSFISIGSWDYAAEDGTLEISRGWFQNRYSNVGGCAQMCLVVRPSVRFKLTDTFETGGLEYESNQWESHTGTPLVKVYGSYKAGAMRPPLKMQDGSTIDLSAMNSVWSVDGIAPSAIVGSAANTYIQPGLVAFEDAATITVELGERKASGQIVSWTTPPPGLAAGTLKFRAPPGVRYSVMVDEETGIYVRTGLYIYLR